MTKIRPLTALTLAGFAALGVVGACAMTARASAEIRQLGDPVTGRLIRDAFGNTIGYEAFSEGAMADLGVSAE